MRSYIRVLPILIVFVASACGGSSDGPTGSGPPQVPQPPAAANPDSALAGRIVYTLVIGNQGILHIHTVANRSSISLGVPGVNPDFSPDGKLIVFQFPGGIGTVNSDGSDRRTVVESGGVPSFDPTGKIIAFGYGALAGTGLWTVNVDGTNLRQLTQDAGFMPAWSPDGSEIAYAAPEPGFGLHLWIANADGSNRRMIQTAESVIDLAWRPSGKIIFGMLVARDPLDYDLYSYDPTSRSLTRLTTRSGNDFEPSWSTDGNHIAWSTVTEGLWIANADGSNRHLVIEGARQGSWGR